MGKIPVLLLIATASVAIASRHVRSPGGSSWHANSGFDGVPTSVGVTRSSGSSSWAGSGGGLGRSASNGGWRGTAAFGSSAQDRGRSANGNREYGNGRPLNKGWSQSGYDSSGSYDGNSFRSYPGWSERFADSDVVESVDSANGWDEPDLGFRSNNGWQSSGW